MCVAVRGGHDLPSTVTWQEHSAWPAPFLAMHLYKPLSSGSAFSMETEHSEPRKEEREWLRGVSTSPIPALAPGTWQGRAIHMGRLWKLRSQGSCGNQPSLPTKVRILFADNPGPK